MPKYKGKNSNRTARKQYGYRAKYASEALIYEGDRHESVNDFNFSERVYYGRIDADDDPVIPLIKSLKPVAGTAKPPKMDLTLPFVKEMFTGLRGHFDRAVTMGNIPGDDPYLSAVTVHASYENPLDLYSDHLTEMIDVYSKEYLTIPKNAEQVMEFNKYVEHFLRYCKILGRNFPITLTAFQKSKKSNIFTNAITLSIADLDCSVDELKEQFFLEKPCVQFYLNVAKQYGFHVNKNAPWILIADLGSSATALYLKKQGLVGARQTFKRYYIKTYLLDINLLSKALQNGYNEFVKFRQFEKEFEICKDKTKGRRNYRYIIDNNTLLNKYNMTYWIPIYNKIRNWEEDFLYNEAEEKRIQEKALSFQKLLDNNRSMRYINEQYRVKHKFAHGGISWWAKRTRDRSEEK